ncbi:MAG: DUF4279 domain-containing protein [Xanthomonadales bacterium]|nr:DUF4279 domain-containing protein [Xanthomonadales bacterium]
MACFPRERYAKAPPNRRVSSWELSSGEVSSDVVNVYELSEKVVNQLHGKAEAIKRIAASTQSAAILQVVLTISMDEMLSTPAIGFSEAVVQFVAQAGAYIDVDTYREAS